MSGIIYLSVQQWSKKLYYHLAIAFQQIIEQAFVPEWIVFMAD